MLKHCWIKHFEFFFFKNAYLFFRRLILSYLLFDTFDVFINIRDSSKHLIQYFAHISFFSTRNTLFNWRFTKNVDFL